MILVVDGNQSPNWLTDPYKNEFEDKDFIRIINFFLYNTPCVELSAKGKSFDEYGWEAPEEAPWKLTMHMEKAMKHSRDICCCETYDKLTNKLISNNWIAEYGSEVDNIEGAVFYETKDEIVAYNLLFHIRNAFAHGRFVSTIIDNNDYMYILEDVSKVTIKKNRYHELSYNGVDTAPYSNDLKMVTARMVLKKSTLLSWIDLIEGGQIEYVPRDGRIRRKSKNEQ